MNKLWGGRFSGAANTFAEWFGASIHFDHCLAPFDVQGSIAHATMLGETGIIAQSEAAQIVDGLKILLEKVDKGALEFSTADEDIHMNVERHLTALIGPVAGKLHTARSRNDQVATDFHLFVRAYIVELCTLLRMAQQTFIDQALTHLDVIMPGYTHLQPAQPVLFAHHLMAYVHMFQRDVDRLLDLWKRVNILPLGAGALAGTTFPINRVRVAEILGFDGVYENSMDAVSDRDFALEYLSCCSTIMVHLSRLCEELIIWTSGEFGFVELDDSLSTGSSIMPQKKNADFAELVRGKTGRVYGALMTLLSVMKGLPLTYNKDMQEDKEGVFDATDTVVGSLTVVTDMVRTLTVKGDVMRRAAERGYINATDAADYLAKKGLPFREAHEVVGKLVRHCIAVEKDLGALTLEEYKRFSPLFESDIFEAIALETVVNRRETRGGTARSAVSAQIRSMQSQIQSSEASLEDKRRVVQTVSATRAGFSPKAPM